MPLTFEAPPGWEDYVSNILHKTRLLIKLRIWDNITELQLNLWLQNFGESPEGKYFAACLLDSFNYRSKEMCYSMMRNVLMDIVPNYCRRVNINNFDTILQWKKKLIACDPLVRFIPVEVNDGRVKSSSVIGRDFIESNDLNDRFLKKTNKCFDEYISNGTKIFVFIDDFSGTGKQFVKCIQQMEIARFKDDVQFLFSPLAAHVNAIESIQNKYEYLKVLPVEVLNKNHEFFYECENGFFRGDGHNSVAQAKKFYEEIFSICGNNRDLYGYGENPLSLTYSFYKSTPNNNIKALYHNEVPAWNRLAFRSQK